MITCTPACSTLASAGAAMRPPTPRHPSVSAPGDALATTLKSVGGLGGWMFTKELQVLRVYTLFWFWCPQQSSVIPGVNCGSHVAASCSECPRLDALIAPTSCGGDCEWQRRAARPAAGFIGIERKIMAFKNLKAIIYDLKYMKWILFYLDLMVYKNMKTKIICWKIWRDLGKPSKKNNHFIIYIRQ